jgi:hypothetical protein
MNRLHRQRGGRPPPPSLTRSNATVTPDNLETVRPSASRNASLSILILLIHRNPNHPPTANPSNNIPPAISIVRRRFATFTG